jgi:predicted ABC-type ATPase
VFAGPNGAGKSTLVSRFRVAHRIAVVTPDSIALVQRRALISAGRSFGLDVALIACARGSHTAEATFRPQLPCIDSMPARPIFWSHSGSRIAASF